MSERYIIPSLDRAFQVLEQLAEGQGDLTLAGLSQQTNIPKSSLFRIMVTLQKHHCVVWNEEKHSYQLGPRLWELGACFLDQSDLYHASSRYMLELAETSGETVFMGSLDEGEVLYLQRMESPKSITAVKKLRQRVPAHCTATGVAILAFLPDDEVEALIEKHGLPAFNETTLTDREALMQRLEQVRREGVAVVDGEYNRELLCISAPVFDHTHRPVASLTVAMLSPQVGSRSRVDTVAGLVRHVAQKFSRDMGYVKRSVARRESELT